jgi:hypothetical protein
MFVLLLENMPEKSHVDLIIKRLYNAMSAPFETKGQEIKIALNIYVSTSTGTSEASNASEIDETDENSKNVNIAGLSLTQARKPAFEV